MNKLELMTKLSTMYDDYLYKHGYYPTVVELSKEDSCTAHKALEDIGVKYSKPDTYRRIPIAYDKPKTKMKGKMSKAQYLRHPSYRNTTP